MLYSQRVPYSDEAHGAKVQIALELFSMATVD